MYMYRQFIEALSDQLYQAITLNLKPQYTSYRVSNVRRCACRIQIGDFVFSSSKTAVTIIAHLGNIPQDHDLILLWPQYSSRCKTSVYHSQCISYIVATPNPLLLNGQPVIFVDSIRYL